MRHLKGICLILMAWLCFSCSDHIIYHANHPFSGKGWNKKDTLLLEVQVTDSLPGHTDVSFLVRNYSDYPYQDFTAVVQHNFPDTTSWRSYKVNFILADSNGKWSGTGWGGLYQSAVSLGEAVISHPGKYTFKVFNQMQDENLSGINDIGILIKKKKENP